MASGHWWDVINIFEGLNLVIEQNRILDGGEVAAAISSGCDNTVIRGNRVANSPIGILSGRGHHVIENTISNSTLGFRRGGTMLD